jgi:hypothetical protein
VGKGVYEAAVKLGWIDTSKEVALCTIDPSFESVHDVFGISSSKYLKTYDHGASVGVFEFAIAEAMNLSSNPIPWGEIELDLSCEIKGVIAAVGESISATARLDDVRLALFLYFLGRGKYILMDNASLDSGNLEVNGNAVAEITVTRPKYFRVGHARSGTRIWSVSRLRR